MITDADLAQFQEQGFFLTEPVIPSAQLGAAYREFERLWAGLIDSAEAGGDEKEIWKARHRAFIGAAHSQSQVLLDLTRAPIYAEACARLIGPDADLYYNQVVIKSPERGGHFNWHQDSGYTATIPMPYITCWTAITRTTVDNGCIWVIPGSHHRGLLTHRRNEPDDSYDAVLEDEHGAVPIEMKPGQVAIFSSLLLHMSGPNISREVRFGYVPQYHHAGVVLASNGLPFGDQVPVLRGGRLCERPVTAVSASSVI